MWVSVCIAIHRQMKVPSGLDFFELPTGQETLTALRDGEGGVGGVGGVGRCWEEGQKWKLS